MPLDTFFLTALTEELERELIGSRIDKIHQPGDNEIILALRGLQGNNRLLITLGTSPRLHLTTQARENPAKAPMFCMLLRKYLTSARLKSLRQWPLERIVEMEWETQDEMGIPSVKKLMVELMGRNANLALIAEDGRVLDCIRRQGLESPRPIQSGLFYHAPESPDKTDPLTVTESAWDELSQGQEGRKSEDFLMDTFHGLSPILAREIAQDGWGELKERFFSLADDISAGRFAPTLLIKEDGTPKEYYMLPLKQYGSLYTAAPFVGSFSQMLDQVCTGGEMAAILRQKVSGLQKMTKNNLERLRKKLVLQEQSLKDAQQREKYRRWGDLLMANLHLTERGSSIEVEDFYGEPGDKALIPLDVAKTLQQNAAGYYKTYRKQKNAESMITAQMEAAREELSYWESVQEELARVKSESDIADIREELTPAKLKSHKQKRPKPAQPQKYVSSTGIPFRAGRNNRQNDELTLHLAGKNDLWLHAQKIPGCHVVIDTTMGPPDEQTIFEAATVAALYSQAASSPKVPVDYTRVRQVKKPNGAKPGMVIYHEFKTILVEPDAALEARLRQ